MTNKEILDFMQNIGALQEGHFRLTSGLHSAQYMQCATVFEYPQEANRLVSLLVPELPQDVDTVIAPAIGGICMGYSVAQALGKRSLFAEREAGVMTLRRGFRLSPKEKVLIVEDVVTTGGSVKEVMDIARQAGCTVVGVASLVDRSMGQADFGVPFVSLLPVEIATYPPDDCPLCRQGMPIHKPGSRQN